MSFRGRNVVFIGGDNVYLASYKVKNGKVDVTDMFLYSPDEYVFTLIPIDSSEKYVAFGDDDPFVFSLDSTYLDELKLPDIYNYGDSYSVITDQRPENTNILGTFYSDVIFGQLDYTRVNSQGLEQIERLIPMGKGETGAEIRQADVNKDLVLIGKEGSDPLTPFLEVNMLSLTRERSFGEIGASVQYYTMESIPETNKFIGKIDYAWLLIDLDIPGDDIVIDITEFLTQKEGDRVLSIHAFNKLSLILVGSNDTADEGFVRSVGFCDSSCKTCNNSNQNSCLSCPEKTTLKKIQGKENGTCKKSAGTMNLFLIALIMSLFISSME